MALPKIALPTFNITPPITKKTLEFRPYTVKEDKIMKMAAQENSDEAIADATRNIINACSMTDMEAFNLPALDVEYIFLQLRAKSVGETQEVEAVCGHVKEDGKNCDGNLKFNVDIKEVELIDENEKERKDLIKINDHLSIKMKSPNFKAWKDAGKVEDKTPFIIYNSIEHIVNGEEITTTKDFTLKEFLEWSDDLDTAVFNKMVTFINLQPHLQITKEVVCKKCNHKHEFKFRELADFF